MISSRRLEMLSPLFPNTYHTRGPATPEADRPPSGGYPFVGFSDISLRRVAYRYGQIPWPAKVQAPPRKICTLLPFKDRATAFCEPVSVRSSSLAYRGSTTEERGTWTTPQVGISKDAVLALDERVAVGAAVAVEPERRRVEEKRCRPHGLRTGPGFGAPV